MQAFTQLTALAAPIDEANIDTNQLCPTRFNKVPRGPGHARILFHDLRFDAAGNEKEFILNAEPWRKARILVADRNFGCGSSRESAVYALYEFGIRCVIAPSFGDIFASNAAKNGLLTVELPASSSAAIRAQLRDHPGASINIDLAAQTVTDPAGTVHRFDVHPVKKRCLLAGLDDIERTFEYRESFSSFEARRRAELPWLFGGAETSR
jgi:3-isopropylmalate/(R)-2-methylmalate dehydratase small subunit